MEGDLLPGYIVGEGVARLVGEHVHIPGGAVEVGEDEGVAVVRQAGAVAAGGFALFGQHVEQLVFEHEVDKGSGLGGELLVHLLAGGQNLLWGALGHGGAVFEFQGVVVELKIGDAQAPGLPVLQLFGEGHQVPYHRVPEGGDVLRGVAVPALAQEAQLHEVLEAQLPGLFRAVLHQLVVEVVELLPVLVEEGALGLQSRPASGPVGALLVGPQLGHGDGLPLEGDLGAGVELLVLVLQPVFLLHQGDNLRGEGLELQLHVEEQQAAQLLFQLFAEGGAEQCFLEGLELLLEQGGLLVVIVVFRLVEGVPGVHGVADGAQGGLGAHVGEELLGLAVEGSLLLGAGGVLDLPGQGVQFLEDCLVVRAGVGKLGKFQSDVTSLSLAAVGNSRAGPPLPGPLRGPGRPSRPFPWKRAGWGSSVSRRGG